MDFNFSFFFSIFFFSKFNSQHKCLIFAEHRQTLDIIENCVLKRYFPTINYKKLDGSVPPIVRAEWAQRFNETDIEENFEKKKIEKKKEKLKSVSVLNDTDNVKEKKTVNDDENIRNDDRIDYLKSDGQGRDRGREQERPSEREEYALNDLRILLMTTRSCGLGLNLTAADTVIL